MRRTLTGRLLVRYAVTIVAVLAGLAFALDRTLASIFLDDLTESLETEARAVRVAIREEGTTLQAAVSALGEELGVRITVIRADGEVLADSSGDPATFENHAGRPEVRMALSGRTGVASRVSASVGEPFRYVALPPEGGRIVRVALPLSRVQERLQEVRVLVLSASALAAVVGVAAVWLIARSITRPLRRMTESVRAMSSGDLRSRVPAGDGVELGLLAETLNRLADDLVARIDVARRERRQLDHILSALEEGIVLVEEDDRVGYVNPRAAEILRGTPERLSVVALPEMRSAVDEVRRVRGPAEREFVTGTPTRTIVAAALPLDGGARVLVVLRDVTAARRVAAMRRDFVADASHELKTPVASIQAAAETVHRAVREDPAAAARFAQQLRRDAVRLSSIVSDLLDLSRLESERPELQPVRLDALVAERVDAVRREARGAELQVSLRAGPVSVEGSPKDLRLLVGNLLDNAVRYTGPGGRIDVAVERSDGGAVLSVVDTGIGIPSRDLPRVFERFYRVDRARSRSTGGTGLGLSIARHVAEQHGGRIEARSELGRGSTFRVWLPARD